MKRISILSTFVAFLLLFSFTANAQTKGISLYGPGGPHVALQKAAEAFTKESGIPVNIVFGPQAKWDSEVIPKADILFSASDNQMVAFLERYSSKFANAHVYPIFFHKAIILVQKGNPKKITGIASLKKPNTAIIVNDGAGISQTSGTGVWEDIVGRTKNIEEYQKIRNNIVFFAPNSGTARAKFTDASAKVDAWITWEDWAIANNFGEMVPVESSLAIYRPLTVALQHNASTEAKQFLTFLQSKKAESIFSQLGWHKKIK